MKLYFVKPGKEAVCIITKIKDAAINVAKELGLIRVNERLYYDYRLSHSSKTLVL